MKTHCDTQPRAGRWHLPALGARNLTHSNPVHQIVFYAFAWQSIWGYEDPNAHLSPPATGLPWVVWVLGVPQLPWPVVFSFGGSGGKPYCSLPPQLPSYFLASALCRCFVQWGPAAKSHLKSVRLGSWCWYILWCRPLPLSPAPHGRRRYL